MRIFSRQAEPPGGWFQIGEVPEQGPRRRGSGRVSLHVVQREQSAGTECRARLGGNALLARANVPAWVRRCCYALAAVLVVAALVVLVPVASRGGDSGPVVRRERAQVARLGAELRSSRQQLLSSENQLRSSHNQLRSSHNQLRSSRQRLESSQRELRSVRRQFQLSQGQVRWSRRALARARRAVVVARSQAAVNGRTHASRRR